MGMIPRPSEETILCVDSDFDYLFRRPHAPVEGGQRQPVHVPHLRLRHRELPLLRPSLHNVCVKATKNDTRIRLREIHARILVHDLPAVVWYAYSAQLATENVFPLIDFKQSVRIGYLDIENNGEKDLEWLRRNVTKRARSCSAGAIRG